MQQVKFRGLSSVIIFLVIFVILEPSEASNDDILSLVRHRHEQTGHYNFTLILHNLLK